MALRHLLVCTGLVACHAVDLSDDVLLKDDECSSKDSACALNAVQLRSSRLAGQTGSGSTSRPEVAGTVAEIYTFGAPAVSKPAFPNLAREDHNFGGLRCYTENILKPGPGKQVDGGSIYTANVFHHPRVATVSLHGKNQGGSYLEEGMGKPTWPLLTGGMYADWGLHHEIHYVKRLDLIMVKGQNYSNHGAVKNARLFVHFAFMAYDTEEHVKERGALIAPDWRLVGREAQDTKEAIDVMWLAQNKKTLECAMVFTGTTTAAEFGTSIKQYPVKFCGFNKVHVGYRDKLRVLAKGSFPKLTPKFAKCSKVVCVGHSLGGSLCDVFSACVNSGRVDNRDYQLLRWKWTPEPELMPAI